jgi:SPP1 family predicted phage head-tail adaptor
LSNTRVSAGKMRHRVQVQARQGTGTQDTFGQTTNVTDPWVTVATRWAEVRPVSGVEKFIATQSVQVSPEVQFAVTMRYCAGLTPQHRLMFNGRVLEIEAVLNVDEINHRMDLVCREEL